MSPSSFDRAQRDYDAQEAPGYWDEPEPESDPEEDEEPEEYEPDLPEDEDFEGHDYERETRGW